VADISLFEPELRFELGFGNWASGFQGCRIYQGGVVTSGEDKPFCVEEEMAESAGASSIVNAGDAQPANDQPGGTALERLHDSAESVLQRGKQRTNSGPNTEASSDEPLPWVHDSWVGECEAAGVYSRKAPTYDCSEKPSIAAALTVAEVRLLAQRHLNTVVKWEEFFVWTGMIEWEFTQRVMCHNIRFQQLAELLPAEEQQRFRQQIAIRDRYVKSVKAEVVRCGKAEDDFWKLADAGLLSEAEIAAHRTPSFIAGLPVMPSPADGGPGPEEWD
jgi:hypothetical protein